MGELLTEFEVFSANRVGHVLQGMLVRVDKLIVELGWIVLVDSVSSVAERLLLEAYQRG